MYLWPSQHTELFCGFEVPFSDPTPFVLHPSFLASLVSQPSHPPRKRKAGTVRQPALGCCFSVLGPFLQVLKDPHLVLTLGLGRTPLTVLPVPSAAFVLAAPVLNHFNFSLWPWRWIQVPFFSPLTWKQLRWCDWVPGREMQFNYFQVGKPSWGKKDRAGCLGEADAL